MDGIRKQLTDNIIHEESLYECNVSMNDIECAITKLNKMNGDGDKGFHSDHTIMSTHRFKVLFSMLINTMFTHGADKMTVSITASIDA